MNMVISFLFMCVFSEWARQIKFIRFLPVGKQLPHYMGTWKGVCVCVCVCGGGGGGGGCTGPHFLAIPIFNTTGHLHFSKGFAADRSEL